MRKLLTELTILLLILLLFYTGLDKLAAHHGFYIQLSRSPLKTFAGWLSWALPIAEIVVAALLCISITKKIGLYASLGLFIAFTLYISYLLLFAPNLPCSCGGIFNWMSWRVHLAVNCSFLVLIVLAIRSPKADSNSLLQ